jgi:hypothetical protein
MLALKRSLFNREQILMNVLKAFVSIISMSACTLIEDYTQIFYMIHKGDIPSIQCKMSLMRPKSMRKVDGLSLIFIDFYVPALTRLNSNENLLQLSENTVPFAVFCIYVYRYHQQRDLDRHKVYWAYDLYIYCKIWGTGRQLVPPQLENFEGISDPYWVKWDSRSQ